jgi:hypothetical protein
MPIFGAVKIRSEPKRHVNALKIDGPLLSCARRGEVPLLIELSIVRKVGFGRHPVHLIAVQYHGAVKRGM